MTATQVQAANISINIPAALVQLRNIYRQYKEDFGDGLLFNAEMSQALGRGPILQEVNPPALPVISIGEDGLHSTEAELSSRATQHKARDHFTPEAFTAVRRDMYNISQSGLERCRREKNEELSSLKEKLTRNKREIIQEILSIFFDSYDKDLGVLVTNGDQFEVPRNIANDLKRLFLLLSEEVIQDGEFGYDLHPHGTRIDVSETLYDLSEYFSKLGESQSTRRNRN